MQFRRIRFSLTRGFTAVATLVLFVCAPALRAEQPAPAASQDQHLVSPAQLQQQVQTSSAARRKNIATLTRFLSTPIALGKMEAEHIDPRQVKNAIPQLSDAELAQLSARAAHAQQQFAAGALGLDTLLIVILLIVIIIIVVR